MPRHLKHTRFSTFSRELQLYGFRKISQGQDAGMWHHASFRRGHTELLSEIRPDSLLHQQQEVSLQPHRYSLAHVAVSDAEAADSRPLSREPDTLSALLDPVQHQYDPAIPLVSVVQPGASSSLLQPLRTGRTDLTSAPGSITRTVQRQKRTCSASNVSKLFPVKDSVRSVRRA